jgi:CRISPR-associated protein Cas2
MGRLDEYRIMWVFVFFDLPTDSIKHRRNYARFRKHIKADGFTMLQFSIYVRHCNSYENAEVHIKRVKGLLPPEGDVIVLTLTDKQFGMMQFFEGKKKALAPDTPQQLEMF